MIWYEVSGSVNDKESKMTKTKKKSSSSSPSKTENEAAMDSLDIDLLFQGGDDVMGGGLLFDDNLLDFGDMGAFDDGGFMDVNNSSSGGGNVNNFTAVDPFDKPVKNRTGGIRTSKGPPHLSGVDAEKRKKSKIKKRRSSELELLDDYEPREKSRRKRKSATIYTDGDDDVSLSNPTINNTVSLPTSPNSTSHRKNGSALSTQNKRVSTSAKESVFDFPTAEGHFPSPMLKKSQLFFPFISVPSPCFDNNTNRITNLTRLNKIMSISVVSSLHSITSQHGKNPSPVLRLLKDLARRNSRKNKKPVGRWLDDESISSATEYMSTGNRKTLANELRKVLLKLNQQSMFMTRSLVNLNAWCNDNLSTTKSTSNKRSKSSKSKSDTKVPFSSKLADDALAAGVLPTIVQNIINTANVHYPSISSLSSPSSQPSSTGETCTVNVKIKCSSFKRFDTITASLPTNSFIGIALAVSDHTNMSNLPKKTLKFSIATKESTKSNNNNTTAIDFKSKRSKKSSSTLSSQTPKNEFDMMSPSDKIKRLANIISHRSATHEQELKKYFQQHEQNLEKKYMQAMKLIESNDDHLYMNTYTLWGLMKKLPYWDDLSQVNVTHALSALTNPEVIPEQEVNGSNDDITSILAKKEKDETKVESKQEKVAIKNEGDDSKACIKEDIDVTPHSLFDRLQSMLVEEDGDDVNSDNDSSDDSSNNSEDIYNIIDDFYENNNDDDEKEEYILDVSDLSLDQRAYIHLRSIHLIDQSYLPAIQPRVIEVDIDQMKETDGNSLENKMSQMQYDLLEQQQINDSSIRHIHEKANDMLNNVSQEMKLKEDEKSTILKHILIVANASRKKKEEEKKKADQLQQSSEMQDSNVVSTSDGSQLLN